MGAGLFICKQIVDKSGGEISVFSEGANKGTNFIFTFNVRKDNFPQDQQQEMMLDQYSFTNRSDVSSVLQDLGDADFEDP